MFLPGAWDAGLDATEGREDNLVGSTVIMPAAG